MSEAGLRVLVVDDERAIRYFLHTSLAAHGYDVSEAETGQAALAAVIATRPDIMILDLRLPDMDGLEVLSQIREWSRMPIVVLSVREHENDKVAALDAGADDYLTKPFGVAELLARLRTALRHSAPATSELVITVGDLEMDLSRRSVTIAGVEVQLTPTEYDILRILAQNAGKVLTHRQLLRSVWGVQYELETHLLRVNISNLRRRIEPDPARPRYILTEPGVGYRLRDSA
jgi:two-component system, OmpR family, KDP operon response regulator KdpE